MLCAYAGIHYENKLYELKGTPGNWDASEWANDKKVYAEKNPLINLPYLVDGDTIVCQSMAVLTYLGRKSNLNGKNNDEVTLNEQILGEVVDIRNAASDIFYRSNVNIEEFLTKTAPSNWDKIEAWLALHKTLFVSSNEPATADFCLWETLDHHEAFAKSEGKSGFVDSRPHLKEFYEQFKKLHGIVEYLNSELAHLPVNNKMAYWK